MQDLKIRTKEFDGLLTPLEQHSDIVCMWAASPPYVSMNSTILPQSEESARVYFPLSNPDLFLSFARLGAQGEPSEHSILRWVDRHGLLRGHDRLREGEFAGAVARGPFIKSEERIVQYPLKVSDFRREIRCANQLLRLYADWRSRDYDAIVEWFLDPSTPRSPKDSTIIERYLAAWRGSTEHEVVKRMLEQGMTTRQREAEDLLGTAKEILLGSLAYTVTDVRLTLTDLVIPRGERQDPLARRALHCPSLLSAIYLQFYLYATNNKPMRHCENPACGMPFPVARKDKRFCNDTCRSNARHYRSP